MTPGTTFFDEVSASEVDEDAMGAAAANVAETMETAG